MSKPLSVIIDVVRMFVCLFKARIERGVRIEKYTST